MKLSARGAAEPEAEVENLEEELLDEGVHYGAR